MNKGTCLGPITVSLDAREIAVRTALAQSMKAVSALNLAPHELESVELVLAEVLNNIVEHALTGAAIRCDIEVSFVKSPHTLAIKVLDKGLAMPGLRVPVQAAPDLDVADCDLPEGGFGWFMLHHLSKSIFYERRDDQNILTILLPTDS